jgi:protein tyrosine phosphatase
MRIATLRDITAPHPELFTTLRGKEHKKISKQKIVDNLFRSGKKELFLSLLTQSLDQSLQKKSHTGTCTRLKALLQKNTNPRHIQSTFSPETTSLTNLSQKSLDLKENNFKKSLTVIRAITQHAKKNPAVKNTIQSPTSKKLSHSSANEVTTRHHKFLLFACPRKLEHVQWLFQYALKNRVSLFVSLLGEEEAPQLVNNFWKNNVLSKLPSIDGWKIQEVASHVIANNPQATNELGKHPEIIQTDITATKKGKTRTFTHLHFNGWCDRSPMPDEKLFATLIETIRARNPSPTQPIAINCRGGVGRTGTTAITLDLQKEIDCQLAVGKDPQNITINVADTIAYFRKFRKGIVGQESHYAQIHSVIDDYVTKKRQSLATQSK